MDLKGDVYISNDSNTRKCKRACRAVVAFKCADKTESHWQWSEVCEAYFTYPYKVFIPRSTVKSTSPTRWMYPVIYGGGLVSGDSLELEITCHPSTSVLITSQAFNRVYKCKPHEGAQQRCIYNVYSDALLTVVPDFMTCYDTAHYCQKQVINLKDESCSLVYLDWFSSGRIANQERWQFHYLQTELEVYINEELALREATVLDDVDDLSILDTMGDCDVFGLLVIYAGNDVMKNLQNSIHERLSQREDYGVTPEGKNLFCSSMTKSGFCVVRFACVSGRVAYSSVESLLSPMFEIYGANPFYNKY